MKKFIVIAGVSAAGLGAISLFIWYYSTANCKKKHRVEIRIPNSTVGYVIGRTGGTLKNIKEKSKATIKFIAPDTPENYTTCVIKGDLTNVNFAAGIIENIVKNFEDGEDDDTLQSDGFEFQVSDDKFFKNITNAVEEVLSNHAVQFKNNELINHAVEQTESVEDFITRQTQKLVSPGGDGLIPVYVSAVISPTNFWIQPIKTKEHANLDRLTMEMSDYYSFNENLNILPHISDVKPGFLCVVFYEDDQRWYRAKVQSISDSDVDISNSIVDLYLLDFGESIYEKIGNLRPIPSQYLRLNFQAVECSLSNVKPLGATWSDEAIQYFEDIVHVGQWYSLMARIDFHEAGYRPYIALIDNNGETAVNIAEKLAFRGFAEILD